jgi:hypothetical protein
MNRVGRSALIAPDVYVYRLALIQSLIYKHLRAFAFNHFHNQPNTHISPLLWNLKSQIQSLPASTTTLSELHTRPRTRSYPTMSVVSLLGVNVLNNPAKFGDSYEFEITFECLESLQKGIFSNFHEFRLSILI